MHAAGSVHKLSGFIKLIVYWILTSVLVFPYINELGNLTAGPRTIIAHIYLLGYTEDCRAEEPLAVNCHKIADYFDLFPYD